jgi:cobyrinic acid a,c-diamide synthase
MKKREAVRGHEFHLSVLEEGTRESPAYEIVNQPGRKEGFRTKNSLASYVHLHFGSKKTLAPTFVEFCSKWREENS